MLFVARRDLNQSEILGDAVSLWTRGPITCQQDTRQASMLSSKMMLVATKEDKPVRDVCQWHEVLSRWHGGVRAELNRRTKRMAVSAVSAHDMAAIRQSSDPIQLTIDIGAETAILQAKAYHTRIQMIAQ